MTTDSPPPLAPPSRSWARRLPGLALLVVLLFLGQYLFGNRPVDVTVHFQLGAAATGLARLDAAFLPAGELSGAPSAEVALSYPSGSGPTQDTTHVRLKKGDYIARVRLSPVGIEKDLPVSIAGEGDVYIRIQ